MLQKNSFFSSPFIFFGLPDNTSEEEEVQEDDEWIFADLSKTEMYHQQKIGLFLVWSDENMGSDLTEE